MCRFSAALLGHPVDHPERVARAALPDPVDACGGEGHGAQPPATAADDECRRFAPRERRSHHLRGGSSSQPATKLPRWVRLSDVGPSTGMRKRFNTRSMVSSIPRQPPQHDHPRNGSVASRAQERCASDDEISPAGRARFKGEDLAGGACAQMHRSRGDGFSAPSHRRSAGRSPHRAS